MVADLLELHHGGQDQTPAFDSFGFVDPGQHVVDDRLVEGGLLAGQVAELLHLELVGKVGDDRPVGLEAAEDERPGDPAQVGCHLVVALALDRDRRSARGSSARTRGCRG